MRTIHVSQPVRAYMAALVEATRTHERVALGVSPRGALALMKGCQAYAPGAGRDYVLPDDVKAMAPAVLAHRMMIKTPWAPPARRPRPSWRNCWPRCPCPTRTRRPKGMRT